MTELKITQADIKAARAAQVDILIGGVQGDKDAWRKVEQAFAAHRIAAEEGKAELVEALERIEGATMSMYFKPADMVQDIKRMAAAALARVRGEG